jgi:light-regulated signal transduction histidine kinase (bacteriophytochrome)
MEKINYDREFCGRVPLHQTNMIQPHGVLLVVNNKDGRIIQASENAEEVFGINVRELVSQEFSRLIEKQEAETLKTAVRSARIEKIPFYFSVSGNYFFSTLKSAEDYYIIEIEKKKRPVTAPDAFAILYQELKSMMRDMEGMTTLEETCRMAINELKKVSGFDKIMIYRFDQEWNGDVIAEVREESMESYLGLKFPASDIPKQARELYQRTAYRLIPNRDYEPVQLYPVLNPITNAFTDLSDSNLRSVAGVHLEYLANMSVVASMSTRIMVKGKLWGLIACHHRTPKYLSFENCALFELLSMLISTKIAKVEDAQLYTWQNNMQQLYTGLLESVYRENDLVASFQLHQEELSALLHADGLALLFNGRLETTGSIPGQEEIRDLVFWLQTMDQEELYQQTHLSEVYEPAAAYADIASGILALPIQAAKGNYLLAFRREAVQTVNWGGNPAEAVQFTADKKTYHPRASFRIWQEKQEHTSLPWDAGQLQLAGQFKNFLRSFAELQLMNT